MEEHRLLICQTGVEGKGIKEVDGFSDKEVKLTAADDRKIVLQGSGLKIVDFSKNSGDLTVCGKISGVYYREKTGKILKGFFK